MLVIAGAGIASRLDANPITLPPSLPPGSAYRLVFVTSDYVPSGPHQGAPEVYNANSTNIADYNAIVQGLANNVAQLAALNLTWRVIASTSAVNAIANIGADAGTPIYDLAGDEVAADATTSGMFSGSLLHQINVDEYGNAQNPGHVWTGTNANGTTACPLGGDVCASTNVTQGLDFNDGSLPAAWWTNNGTFQSYGGNFLYAISSDIPSPTPEPATIFQTALGGMMLFRVLRGKQRSIKTLAVKITVSVRSRPS
jgi:hypothetical protein